MQRVSEDFENLRFEVWTLAISLDSIHSVGSTSLLIDRQPDSNRWALTFTKILASTNAALRPLYSLVKLYLSTSGRDRGSVRKWLTDQDMNLDGVTVRDFRRKLTMLVESLNVFLSSLTHAELARVRTVTETEEYRVLSDLTKNVLQSRDERGLGIDHGREMTTSLEKVKAQKNSVQDSSPSPLSGVYPNTAAESPLLPSWPTHQLLQQHSTHSYTSDILDLDGIETGFRRHMHAMRRIRGQLQQQQHSRESLSTQSSDPSSDPSSDHINTSSNGTTPSQSPGTTYNQSEALRSPNGHVTAGHRRDLSRESRKRGRGLEDFDLEREAELASEEREPKVNKSVLERMLTVAVFFDS